MLNHDETMELLYKAKDGSEEAKEKLISENRPLIKSLIRRYAGRGVEYEDLMQIASVGLLKAVSNFNGDYNVRFSTYAVPMILGEVKRFIRDDGSIKVSRSVKTLSCRIYRYIERCRMNGEKDPSISEIAEYFGVTENDVVFAMDSRKEPVSLFEKTDDGDEQGTSIIDRLGDGFREDKLINKVILKSLIEELSPREKKIILLRFYRDMTQSEIARLLGVSQVQVSRLENKIIEKLRSGMKE